MRLISKASFFCIQALFLSTLLSVRLSHAGQVWEAWAKIYSGPVTNGSDMANAVAIDENGAIYVTGYSLGTDGNNDIATVAYSSNGTALWTNRYDGGTGTTAHAVAIGVRGGGPVYVTGYTGANPFWWVTIAYSAAGAALWTNYYSGPNNSGSPRSLAVGDYGNVYVTGSIYADGSSDDYATVAYSSNKTLLWASRYGGPTNSQDLAEAVAVDNSGRVYVTGSSSSFTSGRAQDYVTVAYSSAGLALWTNVYNGSANSNDLPAAIAAGGGNVYVTGSSRSIAGDYDFATVAYSNSGAPLWTMRYNGPGNGDDRAQAMAADASGNVYVTGYSRGATSSDDYATISYSSAGAVRWVKRYNGPANSVDWARAIALDSRGNVYVSGFSVGLGSDYDFAMIAYANDGTAFSTNRYNGPASGSDIVDGPFCLATGPHGAVVVAGSLDVDYSAKTFYDYGTVKYISAPSVRLRLDVVPNVGCKLELTGESNIDYRLEASSNLVTWISLTNFSNLPTTSLQYTDTLSQTFPARFYRTVWTP